ncbi:MAG: metallophosphoesterase [Sphingomonadaceae bacterium]|nr:metallophosphoesterase [Sphingomonadaceae bacterium]
MDRRRCEGGVIVRRPFIAAAALFLIGAVALFWMYRIALADPVIRRAEVVFPLAEGAAPVRVLLASDIHVAGPDMPPSRLERLVGLMNAERPDLVVLAGDFVSDKTVATARYSARAATAPLEGLRAPLGVFGVMGNHDYWREDPGFEAALRAAGVAVLTNRSANAGPLTVVGIDDPHTRHADVAEAFRAVPPGAATLVFSHSPDVIPSLPETARLVLTGHTHCGQLVWPIIGAITYATNTGARYACGHIREGARDIFVSAGLGTSILPLRLGAVPDIWLITLHPKGEAR